MWAMKGTVSSTPSSTETRPLYLGSNRMSQLWDLAYSGARSVRMVSEVLPQKCGTNHTKPGPAKKPGRRKHSTKENKNQNNSKETSIGCSSPAAFQRGRL